MEFLDDLYFVSLLLGYGVVVSGVSLFSVKWLKPSSTPLITSALKNLRWFGLAIGILAVWFWIEKWLLPIYDNQYSLYAFSERAFGVYAYGVWLSLIYSLVATFLVFYSKTRSSIISWLLIGIVGFGPILYEVWFSFIIQRHSEFLSASYTLELPSYLQIFITAIVAGVVCLFIISIPMLWRFIRKK